MKYLLLTLAFLLIVPFSFGNTKVIPNIDLKKNDYALFLKTQDNLLNHSNMTTTITSIPYGYLIVMFTDCEDYAANAADQEVDILELILTGGDAYTDAYEFWLGYCEGVTMDGTIPLDPVFISG